VEELDRVLDGHDVERLRLVEVADHGGERGALAVSSGADHEHEAAILLGEHRAGRGAAKILERGDARGDGAHDDAERAALAVDVDAEASHAGRGVCGVVLAQRADLGAHLRVLDDDARDVLGVLRAQRLGPEEDEVTTNARRGRDPHLEMDVARLRRDGLRQQLVDVAFVAVDAARLRGVHHLPMTVAEGALREKTFAWSP